MRFRLRRPLVANADQQAVNEGLLTDLNSIAIHITSGTGAPTHSPAGPELYFEKDGPAVHIYNGAWVELV